MTSSDLSTADWLRLINKMRAGQRALNPKIGAADPISNSAQTVIATQLGELEKFGIHKLFLKTKDARSNRYYDLLSSSSQKSRLGEPTLPDNYAVTRSRPHYLTEDATNAREGFRLQVIAHCDTNDIDQLKIISLYCNAVASEIRALLRSRYFRQLEIGSTELDRLNTRHQIDAIQPGTYAMGLCKLLSRATTARGAFFLVLVDNRPFAEYVYLNIGSMHLREHSDASPNFTTPWKSGWHRSTKLLNGLPLDVILDSDFAGTSTRVTKKEHLVLERGNRLFDSLEKLASAFSPVELSLDSIVLAPILHDENLIGCFNLLLGAESPAYSASARSLVVRALDNFNVPARYLFQRRSAKMVVDPIFKSRETRVISHSCFVIMPFSENWSSTVYLTVRNILSDERISTTRADDLFGENVIEDIWKTILISDFIVADVTGRNPNVYYELGIAHAIGKKVILLSQRVEDIPFDTRHLRHIIYSNSLLGFEAIRKGIKGFLLAR